MAAYNELQVGRYVRFFQKLFVMKGRAPAPLTFAGEIGAILGLFHGVENRYLEGWNRFGNSATLGALAANVSAFQMRNISGSNVVVVLEKLRIGSADAAARQMLVTFGTATADLTTINSTATTRLDPRGSPNPNLVISSQQAAAIAGLTQSIENPFVGIAAGTLPFEDLIVDENQELTILPGDALRVVSNAQNVDLRVVAIWRERLLEESERA